MTNLKRSIIILAFLTSMSACNVQSQTLLNNAHSHNDYSQPDPFFHAYKRGFKSIEADVFILDNVLVVAHDEDKIQKNRTLTQLYLKPLQEALTRDSDRQVTLLIDLKGDYHTILPELIKELKPLSKFLKGDAATRKLNILVSGNRPLPEEFEQYPEYINFDEDLAHTYTASELKKIGQISLRYSNYSAWEGLGPIPEHEALAIQTIINAVHALNKPIRFWDAPDNPAGWTELLKLRVDVIGTDKIDALASFLKIDAKITSSIKLSPDQ